jgi:DNA-binding Lrp family transcriptional regulator
VATRAYILVETKTGSAPRLARALLRVPEVKSADVVTGPCDLIVVIDTRNLSVVADLVTKQIQATDSVVHITTCFAMASGRPTH